MEKKDIYEHLAKIYLDASAKGKKKPKEYKKVFKNVFFIFGILISGSIFLLFNLYIKSTSLKPRPNITSELALILHTDVVKINFNFNTMKKEVYSINLDNLDLRRFRAIGFSARKANFDDKITLEIEFTSADKGISEFSINNLKAYKWQDYKILLSDFKHILNWSKMLNLRFIIDEKSTQQKQGIVYIDNVRLLR